MKLFQKIIFTLFVMLWSLTSFGWNAIGHELIAQIAYNHLDASVKSSVNQLIKKMAVDYPNFSHFDEAATWADDLKSDDVTAFNDWHFIGIPFSSDGTPLSDINPENVVWAISECEKVLQSPNSNKLEKAIFLYFFLHFVGDIHQPLHCADRFTQEFPHGDVNGNLFLIHSPVADNLHAFWDRGVGLFNDGFVDEKPSPQEIKKVAKAIESEYPESYFGSKIKDINPQDWANESFRLAQKYAYNNISEGTTPSADYIKAGQKIVKQQIALAGYRLAYLLNQIFTNQLPKQPICYYNINSLE